MRTFFAAPCTRALGNRASGRRLPTLLLCAAAMMAWAGSARAAEPPATSSNQLAAKAPADAASSPSGNADPRQFLLFVEEFTGACVARNGVQVLIRNTHPTRTVRVWLDRYHAGQGTGDRSRSDLAPGGEPDPLGCSRNHNAPQEWRVVRAAFID